MLRNAAIIAAGLCVLGPLGLLAQEKKEIPHTYSLSGPEMYKTWCASCHGADGKGAGPVASALKKAPPDLTQLAKKNAGKFPLEHVREYIDGRNKVDAHGTREMPIWGDALQQIDASAVGISFRVNALTAFIETLQAKIAASTACHAAIKVNMPLEQSKMEWLLDALAKTDCPMSCPHGRPVVLRYSVKEIEKAFHRI